MSSDLRREKVYVQCRPIFTGLNAELRRLKKITNLITKNNMQLRSLSNEIGMQNLIQIVSDLLHERIFESELRAKVAFPRLFAPSIARDVQRQESEAEAAQSTAELLNSCVMEDAQSPNGETSAESLQGPVSSPVRSIADTVVSEPLQQPPEIAITVTSSHPNAKQPESQERALPNLYPSKFPYQTQHLILRQTQQILEECCFDFAKTHMPQLLAEKNWSCAAAVELNKWAYTLLKGKCRSYMQDIEIDLSSKEASKLVTILPQLRHSAVHRIPCTAARMAEFSSSAVCLARVLHDDKRASQLEKLKVSLESQIQGMELSKSLLQDTAARSLEEIRWKRKELDEAEEQAIQTMLETDAENEALIGQLLERSARGIFSEDKPDTDPGESTDEDGEDLKAKPHQRNGEEGANEKWTSFGEKTEHSHLQAKVISKSRRLDDWFWAISPNSVITDSRTNAGKMRLPTVMWHRG